MEMLSAAFFSQGFESVYQEDERTLKAYIPFLQFDEEQMGFLNKPPYANLGPFKLNKQTIHPENWNAKWEESYEPVIVNDQCLIKAPFHTQTPARKYEILIEPQMSFGTGHHATTSLMMDALSKENVYQQKVLDMGCGTAVLAVLASKMGASDIVAIDNDEWAVKNSLHNLQLNQINNVQVFRGEADKLDEWGHFDIILANINRNILLQDIPVYVNHLKNEGLLLISGIYQSDLPVIEKRANEYGLQLLQTQIQNSWVMAKFILR